MIAHYKMQKVSGLREQQDVRRSSELVVFSQIIYIYIYKSIACSVLSNTVSSYHYNRYIRILFIFADLKT